MSVAVEVICLTINIYQALSISTALPSVPETNVILPLSSVSVSKCLCKLLNEVHYRISIIHMHHDKQQPLLQKRVNAENRQNVVVKFIFKLINLLILVFWLYYNNRLSFENADCNFAFNTSLIGSV